MTRVYKFVSCSSSEVSALARWLFCLLFPFDAYYKSLYNVLYCIYKFRLVRLRIRRKPVAFDVLFVM